MNIYFKGPPETDAFAITFDDGPHYYNTPKLLKLLSDFNAKATFFMTGINASRNKALVREVSQQGHLMVIIL
jgi:peptidoglycan/xylan/chitin deacetylase (PgdA/CDA1 family)